MSQRKRIVRAPFERQARQRVRALWLWWATVWRWLFGRAAATAQYRGGFFVGPWCVQPLPMTRVEGGAVFHTADGGMRVDVMPGEAFRVLIVGKPWGQSATVPVERVITLAEGLELWRGLFAHLPVASHCTGQASGGSHVWERFRDGSTLVTVCVFCGAVDAQGGGRS